MDKCISLTKINKLEVFAFSCLGFSGFSVLRCEPNCVAGTVRLIFVNVCSCVMQFFASVSDIKPFFLILVSLCVLCCVLVPV